ncbi:MAG: CheR family methyltransferase [Parvibaculum sp.]|nr:CheR family methyltransferase [Parvibaculum sp.]
MNKSRPQKVVPTRARTGKRSIPARGPPTGAENFLVVGIGASAGGLDACRKLARSLPAESGMAFILIQHLDPTHESMMVDLLAGHTLIKVQQATDGMLIEPDNFYVIPPGHFLAIEDGRLKLSKPQARHGARMPFDFLLQSMAEDCGSRSVCVVLSGTGTDGSAGLKAVKEKCGFVIVQDPDDATYDGMPRNAIITGLVDLVLPVDEIADALVEHAQIKLTSLSENPGTAPDKVSDCLPDIIDLLHKTTAHDFRLYKRGTLKRRIERRMGMRALKVSDMGTYLEMLRTDANETGLLAQDLLINVTNFFRDTHVFDYLADKVIPDLIRNQVSDQPIRVWIAGCSTGEEAYSIVMILREQITVADHNVKLQVFASDVDPDAIATAREGLYPESIESDVTPARLARFFSKDEHGYRVSAELRAAVVFTVHDVLVDPPFSRLDFISCRNLLIYLRPEAQAKAVSVFHFALRKSGVLLLGGSETINDIDGRFEIISKAERLYRHIGLSRLGDFGFTGLSEGLRVPARPGLGQVPSRQATLADLCRRVVMETYAPAALLINDKHEILHSIGPIDRYLQVAPGQPTHDLFAMTRQSITSKIRPAIQQAIREKSRVVVAGGRVDNKGDEVRFRIDIQPVVSDSEELLLICFVDEPKHTQMAVAATSPQDVTRVQELEKEVEAVNIELRSAIRDLELSSEDQKAINEEALSVNEEYQSTNEELLTSQEELQSLNEELTALNSQLQETLERQRTTSNDLQNVLYSTDVATLFLDDHLNIRFFTPATKLLFNVIPSDVGRPLADLNSLTVDRTILIDAREVLKHHLSVECEVQAAGDTWFIRRISPYRAHDGAVEGVVITFTDITDRKHISKALEDAKQQADLATIAKSRFLAAASHDLRQPLQTLALLQGLLAKSVVGEGPLKLVGRLNQTVSAMSSMLNTLLDLNQIEAGTVHPEMKMFPVNDLLNSLREEFAYFAQSQGLELRVVPCSVSICSDPHLLGQMVRNLLANALKYTKTGKVLLGCRRRKGAITIEVLDNGVGIPKNELEAIFEEYHQLDNVARERSRGLGLGLAIVRRLGIMLDHRVRVRSQPGRGSVFTIEVKHPTRQAIEKQNISNKDADEYAAEDKPRGGAILVVEDDPEVRELLELLLRSEGHEVMAAADGVKALDTVTRGSFRPDLLLADYNLPNGMNGLEVAAKLRVNLHREIPVIILTGDISTSTLRSIALHGCTQLNKPVKLDELTRTILRMLPEVAPAAPAAVAPVRDTASDAPSGLPIVFVVDDDANLRSVIRRVLEEEGHVVKDFASSEAFLDSYRPGGEGCLLIDAYLPGMSGLELLQQLNELEQSLPSIMITGNSDVPMAVQAMKAGVSDFIEKPVSFDDLIVSIKHALELSRDSSKRYTWQKTAADHLAGLTARQREIMDMVLAGHPSKNIAVDLGISQRTVENHRAAIMKKTESKSLPALARLVLAAGAHKGGSE